MAYARKIVPRYCSFHPSSIRASRAMVGVRRTDTRCELLLRAAFRQLGVRFQCNATHLPGRPDIVFFCSRTVVFCDGDFWHGRNWVNRRKRLQRGANAEYWVAKIEGNRARDRMINQQLRQLGWRVMRVWETDIRKDAFAVAEKTVRQLRHLGPQCPTSTKGGGDGRRRRVAVSKKSRLGVSR